MISADRSWIFVHIQKTGGNALRAALNVEIKDPHKHFAARELHELYGQSTWESAFKFAFVRNPWDRLVSWWSMIDGMRERIRILGTSSKFYKYVLNRAGTFDEFISRCTDEIVDDDGRKSIFRNQIDYLTDENGTLMVDFIGRFEQLQDDFDKITKRIDTARIELPRLNQSRRGVYTGYYTPALAEEVGRLYARDIAAFGYRFDK